MPKASDLNSLIILFGIESWKPVLTALLLPPVPLFLLILVGARLMFARRGLGWFLIIVSVVLLWLGACSGVADFLSRVVLHPPPALSPDRIKELRSQSKSPTAIMVLGGGIEPYAPEYGAGSLAFRSLERLRYGVWLGRETGLPVGFSGGVGWSQPDGTPEARIAGQIAAAEFGRPLKWTEEASRDTRENAALSVALLRRSGITHVVLVTNGWHMPRALADFEAAAAGGMSIEAAPMGLAQRLDAGALAWMPTGDGASRVRDILRELLGRAVGA
jgi:uncharacterized SAM-binding protein YcdF (DUF218 family)